MVQYTPTPGPNQYGKESREEGEPKRKMGRTEKGEREEEREGKRGRGRLAMAVATKGQQRDVDDGGAQDRVNWREGERERDGCGQWWLLEGRRGP